MHPYVEWPPESHGLIQNLRTQARMAREATGRELALVGTEHGYTSSSIGERTEALGDIRETLILLGEGLRFDFGFYVADYWEGSVSDTSNTYGYYWNLNPKIAWGTDKIAPKIVAPAFAAMTWLLDGFLRLLGPVEGLTGTQMGYRFRRGQTVIVALWDHGEGGSALRLPVAGSSVRVCDWMANCKPTPLDAAALNLRLRAAPVYVEWQATR